MNIVNIISKAIKQNKHLVPYDTGNLYLNAIRIITTAAGYAVIIDDSIADYVYYTNEPWSNGTNPNEGWVDRFFEAVQQSIISQVKLKMGDLRV